MLFDTFKDTIFYKESTNLQKQCDALKRLKEEYPDNKEIEEEFYCVNKGLVGEDKLKYYLSKANLGLYVIHDLNIEFEGMKAQIDYVVISKMYVYFIECKNLLGNITVDENGQFIREFYFNGKKIRKSMYSPLTQVEAQRDTFKKIWNNALSKNKIINNIKRLIAENNFTDTYRTLVVVANDESILDTKHAPKEMKYKILKADALIRQIEYDLEHSDKGAWSSKKDMEDQAYSFIKLCSSKTIDYYKEYKEKYIKEEQTKENLIEDNNDLKEKLIEFRKNRSKEMKIPAYYVFNNDELEEILKLKPKTIEELEESKVLTDIKVKTHGELIIDIINNK